MFRQGNIADIRDKLYINIYYLRLSVSSRHYDPVTRFPRMFGGTNMVFIQMTATMMKIVQTQSLLLSATVSLSRNVRRGATSAGHRRHQPFPLPIGKQNQVANMGKNLVQSTEGKGVQFAGLCALRSRLLVQSPTSFCCFSVQSGLGFWWGD